MITASLPEYTINSAVLVKDLVASHTKSMIFVLIVVYLLAKRVKTAKPYSVIQSVPITEAKPGETPIYRHVKYDKLLLTLYDDVHTMKDLFMKYA